MEIVIKLNYFSTKEGRGYNCIFLQDFQQQAGVHWQFLNVNAVHDVNQTPTPVPLVPGEGPFEAQIA
jgi:hypothetical protein